MHTAERGQADGPAVAFPPGPKAPKAHDPQGLFPKVGTAAEEDCADCTGSFQRSWAPQEPIQAQP
jgi:hypothetical protein